MKKLNILSKTDGWSSGHTPVTLGATVGSPSVHRRGTLLKLLSMLVLMVFGFGQVWADNVVYTFNTDAGLSALGITKPSASAGTDLGTNAYTQTPVSLSATNGSTNTRVWNSSGNTDLRIYKSGGSLTFSVSGDYKLTSIVFAGGTTNVFSVDNGSTGTFSSGTWTAANNTAPTSVKLNATGTGKINTITVYYASTAGGDPTPSCTEPTTALSITNANTATIGTPLTLTSNGGNGGTITWSVAAGTGTASVSGNTLTPLTKGKVTVTATQDVNDGKCGATPTQEITISKAAPAAIAGGVVDQLTSATFASTGSYTAFTNKQASNTGHSAAVYAGKTSRNGNLTKYNIQLNSITSTGNPAGSEIATTTSGGLAKRVYVTWATQTNNVADRKLTVYGQNDAAYTGSETAATGTKIGDIVYASGDTYEYLDITSNYKYIQIVASAAIYMDQIDVTWLPSKAAVTFNATPDHGLVSIENNHVEIASGDEITEGTVLDVILAGDDGYVGTVAVTKTTGGDDVTSTVYNASTGKLTVPDYAITVTVTFAVGVEAPEFDPAGNTYTSEQLVTLSSATNGASIYYTMTTDGSTPADPTSSSTLYDANDGITLDARGTYKIKAIAYKGELHSTVTSATYTLNLPFASVSDLFTYLTDNSLTSLDDAIVTGYVSYVKSLDPTKYTNAQYYISANGQRENELYVYNGKYLNGTDFTSVDQLAVGDKVTVRGNYLYFNNTTHEINTGSQITERVQKGAVTDVVVSGTATKTDYSANETFETGGLVVTVTYANGFSGVVTEGITWGDDLTNHEVTASGTVNVTATVGGVTSDPYAVSVEFSGKALSSIAAGTASYTIYTGEALPKPTITATYTEGDPVDVKDDANTVFDTENVFDTDTPDDYTITVSYTFSGETKTTTYTVTVVDYENADDAPYTVSEALNIITKAIGNANSAREIVVAGTVSVDNISNNKNRYKISDGTNELLVYAGKGFGGANFIDANYPKVGDVVIVKGKVVNYQGNTPEFVSGQSKLLSQIRPATIAIEDVTGFEVGTADMAVEDLTVTTESNGVVTLASSDNTAAVTIVDGKLHAVAAGSATITANLAATSNENALNYTAATTTFSVTVKAATVKYSITFNGNGADGGSVPADIEDKAEGDPVTLPANTYTYTGHIFTGWEVTYVDGESVEHEVTVTANAFTMPAYNVTVKAQWEEISEWAYVYTSNVELEANSSTKCSSEGVTISSTEYSGLRIATGSAAGSATITVPAHANKLHFHVAGWKDVNGSIDVKLGESTLATISLIADDGINQLNNNKAPYTLVNDPIGYYYSVNIPDSESPTDIVFEAPSGKRAVIFGVNQVGGVLPVLDRIEISGDLNKKTGYKAGQALDMTGLTVNAIYKLNSEDQDPVDITEDVEWSYDALVENQTEVTVTATYSEKQAQKTITGLDPVASADPKIIIDNLNVNFGTVATNANVDDQTITVTLTNVASVTAELGGTNPEAFSISKTENIVSGDVITISFIGSTATAGSFAATIAISDGAEGAQDKTVNLSLKVEDVETAVSTTSEWVEATEVADGMEVLITGVKADVTYAVSEQGEKNRTTAAGTLSEGVFTPGANTMPFTLVAQEGENKYALRTSNGKYLYAASGSANQLKTRDAIGDDGKAVWTITIGAENVASIVANCETTSWHNTMQFNQNANNNPVVACYTSASQDDIKLYVPKPAPTVYIVTFDKNDGVSDVEEVEVNEGETVTKPEDPIREGYTFHYWTLNNAEYDFDTPVTGDITLVADWTENPAPDYGSYQRDQLTAGRYGTICLPNGGTIEGATLFDLEYYDGANTLYLLEVNGNAMVAGRPYIFLPSGTSIEVTYTDDADEDAGSYNGLVGSYSQQQVPIGATEEEKNYILYNNKYYLVDDEAYVAPNRAYIHMADVPTEPSTPQAGAAPRRRIAMTVNGKQTPTGFDELNASEAPAKKVINGQLFILRGEKIYDATGRLVK